jgi:hypothetical protein
MRNTLGLGKEQILNAYNIADMDALGTENAMRDFIAQGVNIIIASSWGYMDSCEKLSEEFPGVVFVHCSGYKSNDTNFTNYFGGIREGVTDITGLSALAAPGTAERINAERDRIQAGTFNVFDGELRTNDGRIIGTKGQTLSDSEIQNSINWYYHTVIEE